MCRNPKDTENTTSIAKHFELVASFTMWREVPKPKTPVESNVRRNTVANGRMRPGSEVGKSERYSRHYPRYKTAAITRDGRTTCKQTPKRSIRPPLHFMVRRLAANSRQPLRSTTQEIIPRATSTSNCFQQLITPASRSKRRIQMQAPG